MDFQRWELVSEIVDRILKETSEEKRREILKIVSKEDPSLEDDVIDFLNSIDKSSSLLNDLVRTRDMLTDEIKRYFDK